MRAAAATATTATRAGGGPGEAGGSGGGGGARLMVKAPASSSTAPSSRTRSAGGAARQRCFASPAELALYADTAAEELCVIAASVALGREVVTATLFCATKMIINNK